MFCSLQVGAVDADDVGVFSCGDGVAPDDGGCRGCGEDANEGGEGYLHGGGVGASRGV